jgi:zinc protease
MMNQKHMGLLILIALCLISFQSNGQHLASLRPNDTIPLDPMVRVGKLDNGLTYYIRKSSNPGNSVHINLFVKTGIFQEDEDQHNLAHLLEHIPFTGTVNFSNPIDYFERRGIKRTDLNATTGGSATLYFIKVPASDALIHDGLRFFRDCAGGIVLTTEKINNARGTLYAELTASSGTSARSIYARKIAGDSVYKRVVGSVENIKTFKNDALSRFYHDWYRPDLQTVLIVGDIDIANMEALIRSVFSDLKNPVNKRPLKKAPEQYRPRNNTLIITHENQRETEIEITMRHRYKEPVTVQDFRNKIISELFNEMSRDRFNVQKNRDSPAIKWTACVFNENYKPGTNALSTSAKVKVQDIKKGFQFCITELERLKRYGFTENELIRAKKHISLSQDNNSEAILNEIQAHILYGRSAPGIDLKNEMLSQFVKTITVEEINKVSSSWINDSNRDIVIYAPASEMNSLPTESTIEHWLTEARSGDIPAYRDEKINKEFTIDARNLGLRELTSFYQREIPEIDATDIRLPNGLRVLLRPVTTPDPDSVINIHGFSEGGASVYEGLDYVTATLAANVINQSGLGPFNKVELNEFTSNKGISIYPYIVGSSEGIRVSSKGSALETALYLTHQYFSNPRKDVAVFQDIVASQKENLQKPLRNVPSILGRSIDDQLVKMNFKTPDFNPDALDSVRFDRMYDLYRERFANAADFTFILSGNFDRKKVIPLVAKYLGSLPCGGKKETAKFPLTIETKIPLRKTVYGPVLHDRADVQLRFLGSYKINAESITMLEILQMTLQNLLTKRLRHKEGATYQVDVFHDRYKRDKNIYTFGISFRCAAADVEKVISMAQEEILSIANGLDRTTFDKILEQKRNRLAENLNNSDFWITYLQEQIENQKSLTETITVKKLLDRLTPKDVQSAAREYLDVKKLMQFVILPQAREPEATSK